MDSIFVSNKTYKLEHGGSLDGFSIAFSVYGKLNEEKSNVIWACHGLTGNSRVFDWWPGLFGESDLFNPTEHFIVCANVLGSCYGTSGPMSINSATGEKYYHDFPEISIRDMVGFHIELAEHLGVERISILIGGSLGGQQAVEWAIMQRDRIQNLILISSNAYHSPWGVAFSEAQRMAIMADKTWCERRDDAGQDGLRAARAIGVLSYRNYDTFSEAQKEEDLNVRTNFKASTYQQYQGEKFIRRFDMFSYLALMQASDAHQVGRGRGSVREALLQIKARTLVIGIKSDLIFPISEQILLAKYIRGAKLELIDSFYGHDGFLIETKTMAPIIEDFMNDAPNVLSAEHSTEISYNAN